MHDAQAALPTEHVVVHSPNSIQKACHVLASKVECHNNTKDEPAHQRRHVQCCHFQNVVETKLHSFAYVRNPSTQTWLRPLPSTQKRVTKSLKRGDPATATRRMTQKANIHPATATRRITQRANIDPERTSSQELEQHK